ncbi:MAG: flagellar type III secretion system pore protein FliP [Nocardioides sp.]|nr:flagellar type III secretion system pore protein FliP [Nocardioides sp.]
MGVAALAAPTATGSTGGAVGLSDLGGSEEDGDTAAEDEGGDGPAGPAGPTGPSGSDGADSVNVNIDGLTDKPSTSVTLILLLTLISLLPAILLTCTSFTKVLVVLSLTRNALGLQQTPPNQVLAGLALFLSLFIMSPVLSDIYHDGVKPYLDGEATSAQAYEDGIEPLRAFMLENADDDEIELLSNVADRDLPQSREDTPTSTLIPAFILSELKDAFIIGFIIFIPFLIVDIVVSGALMALGMMMMPPVMVSLPFKLLLFVLVNGWGLIITALVGSYG